MEVGKIKNIPKYVAVICDGNRRWAKDRGLPTFEGHRRGVENFDKLVTTARDLGIECFAAWVFSTENWKRSKKEVDYIFSLTREFTKKYKNKCLKEKIRFVHLGRKDRIPKDIAKTIAETEEETKDFGPFTFVLCIDYGGHDELIRTMQKLNEKGLEITKENIEKNLDTKDLPKIDLIIRTSGEQRLSGFMSWQCAYAEFYFADVHFPDFGPEQLKKAIEDYSNRERRFGGDSKEC